MQLEVSRKLMAALNPGDQASDAVVNSLRIIGSLLSGKHIDIPELYEEIATGLLAYMEKLERPEVHHIIYALRPLGWGAPSQDLKEKIAKAIGRKLSDHLPDNRRAAVEALERIIPVLKNEELKIFLTRKVSNLLEDTALVSAGIPTREYVITALGWMVASLEDGEAKREMTEKLLNTPVSTREDWQALWIWSLRYIFKSIQKDEGLKVKIITAIASYIPTTPNYSEFGTSGVAVASLFPGLKDEQAKVRIANDVLQIMKTAKADKNSTGFTAAMDALGGSGYQPDPERPERVGGASGIIGNLKEYEKLQEELTQVLIDRVVDEYGTILPVMVGEWPRGQGMLRDFRSNLLMNIFPNLSSRQLNSIAQKLLPRIKQLPVDSNKDSHYRSLGALQTMSILANQYYGYVTDKPLRLELCRSAVKWFSAPDPYQFEFNTYAMILISQATYGSGGPGPEWGSDGSLKPYPTLVYAGFDRAAVYDIISPLVEQLGNKNVIAPQLFKYDEVEIRGRGGTMSRTATRVLANIISSFWHSLLPRTGSCYGNCPPPLDKPLPPEDLVSKVAQPAARFLSGYGEEVKQNVRQLLEYTIEVLRAFRRDDLVTQVEKLMRG
jgi:hypothetical protein